MGSEMCIRDRGKAVGQNGTPPGQSKPKPVHPPKPPPPTPPGQAKKGPQENAGVGNGSTGGNGNGPVKKALAVVSQAIAD